MIKIGELVNTQGLHGEMRVYPYTDYKERFEELDYIVLDGGEELEIQSVKYKKNMAILKFKGYDSINDVEKLKGKEIFIKEEQKRELPKGTYHVSDLIGCNIHNVETEEVVGELVDILQNTAQDIYLIKLKDDKRKIMVPCVKEFVQDINIEDNIIRIKFIEGMI